MRFPPANRVPGRLRLWSLTEDVLVEVGPDGDHLVAFTQWGEIKIDDTSPLVRESLQRMSLGPVSVENLPTPGEDAAPATGPAAPRSDRPWHRLHDVLDKLGCCVVQSLGVDDEVGPVLSVAPVTPRARFWLPPQVDPDQPIRLSRYAAMRAKDGELLLESPLTDYRVVLHLPMAAWVVGSLGAATTVAGLAGRLPVAAPVLADLVAYLVASGMVRTGEPGAPARFAEDDDTGLLPWSHHDLLFHARTRMDRHSGQSGAVFPYLDRLPPPPVTRPRPDGPRFPLYRPELAGLAADPPLTAALEADRPHGEYSDRAVTAEQVGELLFRVARIRSTKRVTVAAGVSYTVSDRPYLNVGALYELELYLSVDRCDGLPPGTYHYDPGDHVLTLVRPATPDTADLLDVAKVAAGSTTAPPVLITMTTRIARLSWMYSGIAYSTTLKNVGALQQALSLVAGAMGLASCAPAVGDGAVADHALGLDWPGEVSVGDFVLGVLE